MQKRWFAFAAFAAAMTLIPPPPASAQQADAKAAEVLAAAREALGGEKKLAGVNALSLRATYRRELGAPGGGGAVIMMMGPGGGSATQISGDIEIDVLLPDKYLKVDTTAGPVAITRTEGFDGTRPLLSMRSSAPHVRVMGDNVAGDPVREKAALGHARAELARLLLGIVAGTQPGFAVTYSYVGQAESPDGKADAIDVKGPDGFETRLFIDASTHLPLMLTYMAPEPRVVRRTMGGPGAGAPGAAVRTPGSERRTPAELTPEERERIEQERKALEATPAKMLEYRLFFSDYRDVDGVRLPHHITRGTGNTTTEEWEVTTYKVNPSFKTNRFSVS